MLPSKIIDNIIINNYKIQDLRFPTSKNQEGTDSVHINCDQSAAQLSIQTNDGKFEGHGFCFTLGIGNDLMCNIIETFTKIFLIDNNLGSIVKNFNEFTYKIYNHPQYRWLGPELGVVHMAASAVINSVWDIWAKYENKSIWNLVSTLDPEFIVNSILHFRYLDDALTKEEALNILKEDQSNRDIRINYLIEHGYPTYTTACGWLGYTDDKIKHLINEYLNKGFKAFKIKVGQDINDDIKRCKIVRELIGKDNILMIDANQNWSVNQSIENMKKLEPYDIYWIEEPTSPVDVYGHAVIQKNISNKIKVATGEHCPNRILHKQLCQLEGYKICQPDVCRLGGLNEVIIVCLLAKKYDIPICMHAGGVGLTELSLHMNLIDYVLISKKCDDRWCEYGGALTNVFVHDTCKLINNSDRYVVPQVKGWGIEFKDEIIKTYEYNTGSYWNDNK